MWWKIAININPKFRVRAVGSQKQLPGCNVAKELDKETILRLCNGECFNPSDERKLITRIEVIRIRPQAYSGEPIQNLIEDPWRVFSCDPSAEGCEVEFTDDNFMNANREIIYYVRAIQEPSLAINSSNLNCDRDDSGKCIKIEHQEVRILQRDLVAHRQLSAEVHQHHIVDLVCHTYQIVRLYDQFVLAELNKQVFLLRNFLNGTLIFLHSRQVVS